MIVAFRTTCTEQVGFGHFRRCLTLAHEVARDAQVVFVLAADQRGREIAATCGFPIELLAADGEPGATLAVVERLGADALVCDDYALTASTLGALHARVGKLLTLDDGATEPLDVDAVLNASPQADALPYELPAGALRLFGPAYALLRTEFRGRPARRARAIVERILVTLGGSNPGDRTEPIVRGLLAAVPDAVIEVVVGPLFEGTLLDDARVVVHRSPRDMADLMTRADLAISAGGQTTYELAACGVPAVAVCVADNQRANLTALAAVPTLRVAEDHDLLDTVRELAGDPEMRQLLSDRGRQLVDGRGAERAWDALAARWQGRAA